MQPLLIILSVCGFLFGFLFLGYFFHRKHLTKVLNQSRKDSEALIAQAKKQADQLILTSLQEAKEETNKHRNQFAKEAKKKRLDYQRLEQKTKQREANLDKKADDLKALENSINEKNIQLALQKKSTDQLKTKLDNLIRSNLKTLQEVANMSVEQAKKQLMSSLKQKVMQECETELQQIEEQTKHTARQKAQQIIALAIQKQAGEFVNDSSVTVMPLPSEEMKGRIIGREGRNIRAIEQATGVDIIIDDTPEAVILSCFNGLRREIAKTSMERLIEDGRIHPARIQETVDKVTKQFDQTLADIGEQAALDAEVTDLHPTLTSYLGHLKFKTLGKQSVLQHSIETAKIAQIFASELNLSAKLAARAGLLHDIGQAVNQQSEGDHAKLGADLCERYGEQQEVIQAILNHHNEELDYADPLTICVNAANLTSSQRLGARNKDIQSYIKRLAKMENIVANIHGVQKALVFQTGREIIVIVDPEHIIDSSMTKFTKQIAAKLNEELTFAAKIKVTALRTTKFIDYAK